MNGSSRRQWVLLAGLAIAVFAYFRFGGASLNATGDTIGDLPPIDIGGVLKSLQGVNTVKPDLVPQPEGASDPDRNLFQYGNKRAPAEPPMSEPQRLAAQELLRNQELKVREEAEQARQRELEAARVAALTAPPPAPVAELPPPVQLPPAPVERKPPEINYRLVGMMGPVSRKVGVFLTGDKMVLAKKGEVIEGRFKVLDIGPEYALMGYTDPEWKDSRKRLYFGPQ